jgi:hypothetical protein
LVLSGLLKVKGIFVNFNPKNIQLKTWTHRHSQNIVNENTKHTLKLKTRQKREIETKKR